jgi:hypothetical protein
MSYLLPSRRALRIRRPYILSGLFSVRRAFLEGLSWRPVAAALGGRHHLTLGESELGQQDPEWVQRAAFMPMTASEVPTSWVQPKVEACSAVTPAVTDGQDFVAVGLVLFVEHFPGGKAHDAGLDAFARESSFVRGDAQRRLTDRHRMACWQLAKSAP